MHDTMRKEKTKPKHFKNCKLLLMIHTTIDEYSTRMGLRDTWLQYIKQNQVQNISYVFLIAKEKSGQVLYPLRKERIKNEQAKFNDILQVDDLGTNCLLL